MVSEIRPNSAVHHQNPNGISPNGQAMSDAPRSSLPQNEYARASSSASFLQGMGQFLNSPISKTMLAAMSAAMAEELPADFFKPCKVAVAKSVVATVVNTVPYPTDKSGTNPSDAKARWLSQVDNVAEQLIKRMPFLSSGHVSDLVYKELKSVRAFVLSNPELNGDWLQATRERASRNWASTFEEWASSPRMRDLLNQVRMSQKEGMDASRMRDQENLKSQEMAQEETHKQALLAGSLRAALGKDSAKLKQKDESVEGAKELEQTDISAAQVAAVGGNGANSQQGHSNAQEQERGGEEEAAETEAIVGRKRRHPRSVDDNAADAILADEAEPAYKKATTSELLGSVENNNIEVGLGHIDSHPFCCPKPLTTYNPVCSIQFVLKNSDPADLIVIVFLVLSGLLNDMLRLMVNDTRNSNNQLQDYGQMTTLLGNLSANVSDTDRIDLKGAGTSFDLVGRPTLQPTLQGQSVSLLQAICAYGFGLGATGSTDSGGTNTASLCQPNGTPSADGGGNNYSWITGKQANSILSALRQQNEIASTTSQTQIFKLQDVTGKQSNAIDTISTVSKTTQNVKSRINQNIG